MLKFITFETDGETIAINPNYVAHISEYSKDLTLVITMCDGRRYEIERDYTGGINVLNLVDNFEMKANYGGI